MKDPFCAVHSFLKERTFASLTKLLSLKTRKWPLKSWHWHLVMKNGSGARKASAAGDAERRLPFPDGSDWDVKRDSKSYDPRRRLTFATVSIPCQTVGTRGVYLCFRETPISYVNTFYTVKIPATFFARESNKMKMCQSGVTWSSALLQCSIPPRVMPVT